MEAPTGFERKTVRLQVVTLVVFSLLVLFSCTEAVMSCTGNSMLARLVYPDEDTAYEEAERIADAIFASWFGTGEIPKDCESLLEELDLEHPGAWEVQVRQDPPWFRSRVGDYGALGWELGFEAWAGWSGGMPEDDELRRAAAGLVTDLRHREQALGRLPVDAEEFWGEDDPSGWHYRRGTTERRGPAEFYSPVPEAMGVLIHVGAGGEEAHSPKVLVEPAGVWVDT